MGLQRRLALIVQQRDRGANVGEQRLGLGEDPGPLLEIGFVVGLLQQLVVVGIVEGRAHVRRRRLPILHVGIGIVIVRTPAGDRKIVTERRREKGAPELVAGLLVERD